MKIGFELNDAGFSGIDLTTPEGGNPGIGGTPFEFALVIKALLKYTDSYEIFVYHYNNNLFSDSVTARIVKSEEEVILTAKKDGIDVLIYKTDKDAQWYALLSKYEVKSVGWAHTYLKYDEIREIANCKEVIRFVCVGKEQYDAYIDNDIISKAEFIYNMFDSSSSVIRDDEFNCEVTYIGSIIREKGFHSLAMVWKDVLKCVPDAKLNVIGSGKLYSRNSQLGTYGIAEKTYEDSFIKYLIDSDGNILPSVKFWGILGAEKSEIIRKTAVGVVNPTAVSETFCISAVEFEAQGIPVCSARKKGLLDTVRHKETGILSKGSKELRKSIVTLLTDRKLNTEYGNSGVKYVRKFQPEVIVKDWDQMFQNIDAGIPAEYHKVTSNYFNDGKIIRLIVRFIRFNLKIKIFPSVDSMIEFAKRIYHKFKGGTKCL